MKSNYIGYKLLSNFSKISTTKLDNIHFFKNDFSPSYNKYISFGDSLHICLEKYNKALKNKQKLNYTSISELLKSSWVSIGYSSKDEEMEFYKNGLSVLKQYFLDRKDIENNILFVEDKLTKSLSNGNIVLFGKPDKVFINKNNELEIVDYKTSKKISYNFNPLYDTQLLLYIILVKDKVGLYPSVISRYYLQSNTKVNYTLTTDDISYIEEYFATILPLVENYYLNDSLSKSNII